MIPLFKVHFPESAIAPLKDVLLSGYIGQGPKVEEFEKALAPWVGNTHALSVNSGTSSLHLAMRLARVEKDTEVIVSPMTCAATIMPAMERGADIVWADIHPWTGCIDPLDVERKITKKTRAIVAIDWAGYPCDLQELQVIADNYGISLIEDAAHAFGASYHDKPVGSHCDYVCFSFQAIKHLTTVDGGLLTVRDPDDYRRGKLLRWFGIDRETPRKDLRCEEDIKEFGYKHHMSDVTAVIGLEQLKYVGEIIGKHRENAAFYDANLPKDYLLRYEKDRLSSYWIYTIRVKGRERFQEYMKEKGIMVSQVHVRNDTHTAFAPFVKNLPGVNEFSREQVSIPVGWWVSPRDRDTIVAAVREWKW